MNIPTVSAHPKPASLTNASQDGAVEQLRADGHDRRISDLYAASRKAVVDRGDFPTLQSAERLKVAATSGEAFAAGAMTSDTAGGQAELIWSEALILVFPFWWLSFLAILRGRVDRIVAYGFACGVGEHSDKRCGDRFGEGRLAGRRAMLVVSAGGWQPHDDPRGIKGPIDDLLFPIDHGVLFYPRYEVLPPFVVDQADRLNDDAFRRTADEVRERMCTLFTASAIPFRQQESGDDTITSMQLRAELAAPDPTGFAAHVRPSQ